MNLRVHRWSDLPDEKKTAEAPTFCRDRCVHCSKKDRQFPCAAPVPIVNGKLVKRQAQPKNRQQNDIIPTKKVQPTLSLLITPYLGFGDVILRFLTLMLTFGTVHLICLTMRFLTSVPPDPVSAFVGAGFLLNLRSSHFLIKGRPRPSKFRNAGKNVNAAIMHIAIPMAMTSPETLHATVLGEDETAESRDGGQSRHQDGFAGTAREDSRSPFLCEAVEDLNTIGDANADDERAGS